MHYSRACEASTIKYFGTLWYWDTTRRADIVAEQNTSLPYLQELVILIL